MDLKKEAGKAVDSVTDIIDELLSKVEDLENENCKYEKENQDLLEKVDELESTNRDLMEHIDELKMEILEAKKLITESEHQSLNNMYFSVDAENKTVAQEVINNLYNK